MSWEPRRGTSRRYYTRSRRVGGRVVREYVGTGEHAEAAAREDAERRARREQERDASRAESDELCTLDQSLNDLHDLAELLTQAALLVAGYRQHKRGEWRKSRVRTDPS